MVPWVLLVSVRIPIVTGTYLISYTLLISVTSCRYLGLCDKSHVNSLLGFWGKLLVNLPEGLALVSSAHLPWSFGRTKGNIWSAFLSASILVALLGFSHDSVPLLSSDMGT